MAIGFSEVKIGLLSSFIDVHANLSVQSIDNYGDDINSSGANVAVGFGMLGRNSDGQRHILTYRVPLATLPRRARIADARFVLPVSGKFSPVGYSYTGWPIDLYEFEGDLAAGTTSLLRSTGVTWYGGGYGPKPGYDYVTPVAGTVTPTTPEWNALNNAETPVTTYRTPFEIPCTAAVQRASDGRTAGGTDYFEFMLMPGWEETGAGHTRLYVFDPVSSVLLNPHLWIRYWPAIGIVGADNDTEDRPPDYTKLHNPALAGTQYKTYLDVVEEGTAGTARKYWGTNFSSIGPRKNVVVGTGKSEATTVKNSGSVSGITLLAVETYDHDTDASPNEGSPSGDFVVKAISGTTVSVDYTDSAGTTVTLQEVGTGNTVVTTVADRTFKLSGVTILTIRTTAWSATTGMNTADRWRFSVRGDLRTTESVDTPGLVRICPPTSVPFGDTADTSTARQVSGAYTQQLRAAALNRTISAVSRGHLLVRETDTTAWDTSGDGWVEAFNADGSFVVRGVKIIASYPSTDPDYPRELRIDRDWTAPELAALDATSSVTGGVYLGNFAAFQVRRLASAAAAGQPQIVLEEAFDEPPDFMQLVGLDGTSGMVERQSGTTTLTLTADLANTYADEALVFLAIDPGVSPSSMSSRPFFALGDVPSDADEGLYRGWYRLFEHKVLTS